MKPDNLAAYLRFYFITDHHPIAGDPAGQVAVALAAGATAVQYRNKDFRLDQWDQALRIQDMCRRQDTLFIVNDNVLLAKALGADGVHLGQDDCDPVLARNVLGPDAVVGLSVSNLEELERSNLDPCDYVGSGPVFATATKADAKPVRGLAGLADIVSACRLPVVAIGGITVSNAGACLEQGAAGVAVISHITRASDPAGRAAGLARALGIAG